MVERLNTEHSATKKQNPVLVEKLNGDLTETKNRYGDLVEKLNVISRSMLTSLDYGCDNVGFSLLLS
jgi:hypothetical protein